MKITDLKKSKESLESTWFRVPKIHVKSKFWNIMSVLVLSLVLSIIGALISSDFSMDVLLLYLKQPMLFILNALPLVLIMLCIFIITSRMWISYLVSGSLYLLIQMVNYFKISLRHEPFVPADLLLGNESTNVLKMSELPINGALVLLLALFLLGGLCLFLSVKSKPTGWLYKVIGTVLTISLSVVLYSTCYKNENLYDKFKVRGTIYSSVDIVRSRGFIYSFLVKANSLKLTPPEGYSVEEAKKQLENYGTKDSVQVSGNIGTDKKMPNVIAIMSEAFFDIDRIPGIEFNEANYPLKNFNRISKDGYRGRIVTTVFGGGTSNTECAFLTGTSLSIANWTADTYSAYIRKDTFSLTRLFESKGYKTSALHVGYPWFYNRFNVYDYFGFDNRFFTDDVKERNTKSLTGYASDMDTYKFLLSDFQNHLNKDPGSPYFNFTVTIENHGPYPNESIGYPGILKHSSSVNEEYYQLINNYAGGLQRNDEALGYLVDQLDKSKEPVVLVYFGDHLPFLGEDFAGYKAMNYNVGTSGSVEEYLNTYETPYLIWSNKSAKDLLEQQGIDVPVGEAPTISSNYLCTELLDYIGAKDCGYFDYLNDVKASLPVITGRFYKTSTGEFTENLPEKDKKTISQYRDLQYYMLFDNQIK